MSDERPAGGPFRPDAESRFAAVLKFDLVDSTGLSQSLTEDDEHELLTSFRREVDVLVRSEQVTLEREGDGGAIVFGSPRVRIDAVEAAVRTAFRLIEAIRRLDVVPSITPQVRIGIASGRVTVDTAHQWFSRVRTFSRAKRLMEQAAPGQIVIDGDTRRLVNRFFEYEDIGIVDLKGIGAARAWRVVRESTIASRFAAQHVDEAGPIIGRDDVIARLAQVWEAVRHGRGAAVALVGDSGLGKSRLARAVLAWAARDRAVVLEIDCRPSAANSPLLPIGVLLRRTAGITATTTEADKRELAEAMLVRLLGHDEAAASLVYLGPLFGLASEELPRDKTREQVHAATIAAVVGLVRALARREALVVLCEDLHWADDTTARLVRELGAVMRELPALLVVTHWPRAESPVDLSAATAGAEVIELAPLAAGDAGSLVREVCDGRLDDERVEDIVARCGGVPLLLEEVARTASERGTGDAPPRSSPAESAVPPELQVVVESRLERYPQFRDIIEAAAVLGREFPVTALDAMMRTPERQVVVPAALAAFTDHGLLSPQPPGHDRASFKHALIRDAVYETIVSRDYRQQLHSVAADVLSRGYSGTADASPDVVASHLRTARRFDAAIRVRLAAGRDTFNRGAYKEAEGHCHAVRELLAEAGGGHELREPAYDVRVLLGMVYTSRYGYSAEAAEAAYADASGMFHEGMTAESRYPVMRGLATASLVRGELATAHGYAEQARELAEASGRPDFRIDAMSVLSYTTLYFGRLADARTWIERCLELYEREHGETLRYPVPQDAKTAALALLPTVAWLLGDPPGAEAAVATGLAHVEHLDRDFDKALLHAWTAGTRYTQRRYAESLAHAVTAMRLGEEHNFQEWKGVGAMMTLLCQAALEPRPELVDAALATARAFGERRVGLNASYYLWGIARGYVTAGRLDQAHGVLQAALAAAAASGETRMNPELWILQAEIEPEPTRALTLLGDAFDLAERQGAVANALRAAAAIVSRRASGADREAAQATLARLDGLGPDPDSPAWMHEALSRIGTAVRASYSRLQGL